jgi:endoribonuclease Dicer
MLCFISLIYAFKLKVYTCVSDTVISQFIPMSTPKFRYYKENVVPYALFDELAKTLNALKEQVCTFNQIIHMYALK